MAEDHPLSLQQALEIAARQNPDVVLARLDQRKAEEGVRVARDPFRPKVYGGSGLAYTYGYPNTIEGSAPSLFQVRTEMSLFNRPKSYEIAAARETARAFLYGAQAKADEVAYQTADLFLTASLTEHEAEAISGQIPSLEKVVESTEAAVSGGTELPVERKRAQVNLAASQQTLESDRLDSDYYEMMLAVALGYPATDRVKPRDSRSEFVEAPASEHEAEDAALRNNRELSEMQSNVLAKELDLRSYRAARLPQVDLVAQYALFAKYNYQYFFPSNKFQANNFQLGASVTIPLLVGSAAKGYAEQALTDLQKLRIQTDQVRNRVLTDTRRSYQQWKKAEGQLNVARMQLDLAREDLSVLLAQNAEGRMSIKNLEQARLEESNRWLAFYDAETQVTRTKLAVLREMGTLLLAVRASEAAKKGE